MARGNQTWWLLLHGLLCAIAIGNVLPNAAAAVVAEGHQLLLVTTDQANDFVLAAMAGRSDDLAVRSFASISAALSAAGTGDGLMILADNIPPSNPGYPSADATVVVTAGEWNTIDAKRLKVYVEFPRSLPGAMVGGVEAEAVPLTVNQTLWERAVVSAVDGLGPGLEHLALLHPHKYVDYVHLPAEWTPHADLVLARVAGYDSASLGLPPAGVWPLLVRSTGSLMVAATQLSHCRTRRFAPNFRWVAIASHVLSFVTDGRWQQPLKVPLWMPAISATYGPTDPLPPDAERNALLRGVDFYRRARLMPGGARANQLAMVSVQQNATTQRAFARMAPPFDIGANISGDGRLGIFEGLLSDIDIDGKQLQSNGVRSDCVMEASAAFAVVAAVGGLPSNSRTASNLLDYGLIHSGMRQPWAVGERATDPRPWVLSGDAFGLINCLEEEGLWYSDGDARDILAAVSAAGLLETDRYHTMIATSALGSLRMTTRSGFGPSSAQMSGLVGKDMSPEHGWRKVFDSTASPKFSPHYEAYNWAVLLWAHSHSTGFELFLERAQAGITTMMEGYPHAWIPTQNGIAMQRARILLPLAWLVRVNDTQTHRDWLQTAVDGLLTLRYCPGPSSSWCAIREELSHPGWGGNTRVPTNADYGTFESPLNQENSDPVSDLLYTTNFALLGLHEAAAVLRNETIKREEDRLAEYIVRLQTHSTEHPELDGAFFRAWDFAKWEVWASDADIGWGAWAVESGWSQSWLTITLGLRQLNTSLWDVGQSKAFIGADQHSGRGGIGEDLESWADIMFPAEPPTPPPQPKPCVPAMRCIPRGIGDTLNFTLLTSVEGLCAKSNGSWVLFTGHPCSINATRHGEIEINPETSESEQYILWTGMKTLDPRAGKTHAECQWSRDGQPNDIPRFFGQCGVCPLSVGLPTAICP